MTQLSATILTLMTVAAALSASDWQLFVLAESPTLTLFFRDVAETYRNENSSIVILDGAYPSSPTTTEPHFVEFQGNVEQEAQVFLSKVAVWIGAVSWLSPAFTEGVLLSGQVTFTVWLESDDPDPSASGIGVGLVVVDEQGGSLGEPQYHYQYRFGNILTSEPAEHVVALTFSAQVLAGQRLALTVGAGSSIQGWHVRAHFDSVQFMSRADFPTEIYVIPEFPTSISVATMVLAITLRTIVCILRRAGFFALSRRVADSSAALQARD